MAAEQTALRAKYENYNFHLIIYLYLLLRNVKREQFSSLRCLYILFINDVFYICT